MGRSATPMSPRPTAATNSSPGRSSTLAATPTIAGLPRRRGHLLEGPAPSLLCDGQSQRRDHFVPPEAGPEQANEEVLCADDPGPCGPRTTTSPPSASTTAAELCGRLPVGQAPPESSTVADPDVAHMGHRLCEQRAVARTSGEESTAEYRVMAESTRRSPSNSGPAQATPFRSISAVGRAKPEVHHRHQALAAGDDLEPSPYSMRAATASG